MTNDGYRSRQLDPDFRRDPKTDCFCALCQKDIKGDPDYYAHFAYGCVEAIHPDDRDIANAIIPAGDNYGILPVGTDCARKIGLDFVYTAEKFRAITEGTPPSRPSTTPPSTPGR